MDQPDNIEAAGLSPGAARTRAAVRAGSAKPTHADTCPDPRARAAPGESPEGAPDKLAQTLAGPAARPQSTPPELAVTTRPILHVDCWYARRQRHHTLSLPDETLLTASSTLWDTLLFARRLGFETVALRPGHPDRRKVELVIHLHDIHAINDNANARDTSTHDA